MARALSGVAGGGKFYAKKGTRYALIIGDEGAILIYIDGGVVKSRNFIASASPENLKEFADILAKDVKSPLYIIIDSMDQSFVQQTLPPISQMGVAKLINRRLDRDLGKDVIKGYVLLEREKTGRRDWNFLMVSLEKSPQLTLWLEFVEKIGNRLAGIYLLSVEAEYIVKALDAAMGLPKKNLGKKPSKKDLKDAPPSWKLFVSNNKVGGFRQVVLKDGRIIFTRLTQPVGDASAGVVSGNIEQEMSSTIEYMKRLSFNSSHGLDVYIIASEEVNSSIDLSKIQASNVYKFTPFEVAEFVGITGAAQTADQFGDVIVSSIIASNSKHRLKLVIPSAKKIDLLHNVMVYQRAIAGLLVLVLLGYGGMQGLEVWDNASQLADLEQTRAAQQRRLDSINDEIKKSGIEVTKIAEINALYTQLLKDNRTHSAFMARLREAIVPSVSIKEVDWSGESRAKDAAVANVEGYEEISLVLKFPEVSGTGADFSKLADKILKDVAASFPEYKVSYAKIPEAISKKNESGKIDFNEDPSKAVKIDPSKLEATLLITKQGKVAEPQSRPASPLMESRQGAE